MPVFDIDLENVETTDRKIKAVMLYPDDPEQRQNWFALYQTSSTAKTKRSQISNSSVDEGIEYLEIVRSQLHSFTYPETRKRLESGRIAGGILVLIKQLNDQGAEEPGVNKAICILEQWVKEAQFVTEIPTSRTKIFNYWTQFQPVAHLWADFYMNACGMHPKWRTSYSSAENLLAFLSRAEWWRCFGENHIPKRYRNMREKKPTLPPNDTWKVPENLTLPDFEITLPALTEQQQKIVDGYIHY
jgi:hypothetical protein